MIIGRCETLVDFNAGVDLYFTSLSQNASLNVKDLYRFLKANGDYEYTNDTAEKISSVMLGLSSIVDKDSSQHKTLSKIERFVEARTNVAGKPQTELRNLFGSEEGIRKAIQLLRHDRFTNDVRLAEFLKELIGELPVLDEAQIKKAPFQAMLILILRNNPAEDHLRGLAADAYISQNPDDKRFEKAYVYLNTPNILLAHLLLYSNKWSCANPANLEFYDEQMAGLFHGTIAFDKGDRLSSEELAMVQEREGEKPRFPIGDKLEKKEGYFEVKDWCSTPPMSVSDTRLDDLFIASRRELQEKVVAGFVGQLEATSGIVQKVYGLPSDKLSVVAVIGPYGVGKSKYVQQKFLEEEPITVFSLDKLNELLMNPTSRRQDHHFEAMMLTNKLLKHVNEIPVLLTEIAAIDEFRFNRLLTRDWASRHIVIEEIAPENEMDSVAWFIERENIQGASSDQSRMKAAMTSAKDALRFRAGRIERAVQDPKVDYTLYCSSLADATLTEVAKVKNGVLTINEDEKEVFNRLTPGIKES